MDTKQYDEKFLSLIEEAQQAHFAGWDFSWLAGRSENTPTPWNYRQLVIERIKSSSAMLDMDTGGGEFLAQLPNRPLLTCATENYAPNIPIAKARLGNLGIKVHQNGEGGKGLPFNDNTFDLIINRHSEYDCTELMRVLQPGGIFLTQQVGPQNEIELNQFLAPEIPPTYSGPEYSFDAMLEEFKQSGFEILRAEMAGTPSYYYDIGAVVYYLKVISWQIPGFVCEERLPELKKLHDLITREGKFTTMEDRLLFIVRKPSLRRP